MITVVNNGLSEKNEQLILNVLKKNPHVETAILFGSRALQTYKDNSDIDLVIDGENLSLTDLAQIQGELEQTTLPYQVDILLMSAISNPNLLDHIKKFGVKWI